jgi:hypothetical protein
MYRVCDLSALQEQYVSTMPLTGCLGNLHQPENSSAATGYRIVEHLMILEFVFTGLSFISDSTGVCGDGVVDSNEVTVDRGARKEY